MRDIRELATAIQYPSGDRSQLELAMTHASLLNEKSLPDSNRRLAWLGDAVIDVAVSQVLFDRRAPNSRTRGGLTEDRKKYVRMEALVKAAKKLDLGSYLRMGKGAEASGGRDGPRNLAEAFEALLGAVFVAGRYNQASRIVQNHLVAVVDSPP
jgi:ribonuclease-3